MPSGGDGQDDITSLKSRHLWEKNRTENVATASASPGPTSKPYRYAKPLPLAKLLAAAGDQLVAVESFENPWQISVQDS